MKTEGAEILLPDAVVFIFVVSPSILPLISSSRVHPSLLGRKSSRFAKLGVKVLPPTPPLARDASSRL